MPRRSVRGRERKRAPAAVADGVADGDCARDGDADTVSDAGADTEAERDAVADGDCDGVGDTVADNAPKQASGIAATLLNKAVQLVLAKAVSERSMEYKFGFAACDRKPTGRMEREGFDLRLSVSRFVDEASSDAGSPGGDKLLTLRSSPRRSAL